jgi:folate-dependent tRNA-U54 methylase TrmFO/GidA
MVHRNTYVNGPVLADTWQVRTRPSLFLAGQMSGVEGASNLRRQACSPASMLPRS